MEPANPVWLKALLLILVAIASYTAFRVLHNLVFHPLSRFPGPKSAAISNFRYSYWFLSGRQPYHLLALHEKYGPVVRVAPNELSFNTAGSWRDIYDFRPGHATFIKADWYDNGSFADECGSIVSERNPEKHGKFRKQISPAFSHRSLSDQESTIARVVDLFVQRIGEMKVVKIGEWFNKTTFDIIGELAFGQTFGCVESGEYHPWIARALGALKQGALVDTFKRFPLVAKVVVVLFSGSIQKLIADTKRNEQMSIDMVKQRIASKTQRRDFFTRILEEREESTSDIQLAAHASDFVLAGSETTATTLSCATHYLLKNPDATRALQQEIRTTFDSYEQITAASTTALPYLNAVCLEALRIYPPLPLALPREVPQGGDTVDGFFVPGGVVVSTSPVAACLDARNFSKPLVFRPERWLDGNTKDILDASQPFSLGPRGCIGRNLGWMEMRTILAKMHFTHDFERDGPDFDWQEASQMHTLWHRPQLYVKVLPRRS